MSGAKPLTVAIRKEGEMAEEGAEERKGKWIIGKGCLVEGTVISEGEYFLMVRLTEKVDAGFWVFEVGDVFALDKAEAREVDGYWERKEV